MDTAVPDEKKSPEHGAGHDSEHDTHEGNIEIKDSTKEDTAPGGDHASVDEPISKDMLESATPLEVAIQDAEKESKAPSKSFGAKRGWTRKKIALVSSLAVVVILGVLFAVPLTRYAILGVFVHKDVTFTLVDSKTNKPVSGVTVSAAGKSASSDAQGKVMLKDVAVGDKSVTAKKKYYQDLTTNVLVPLTDHKDPYQLSMVATGRQVPVKIINKISTQPIEKAVITFDGSASTTDATGQTTMVLPADKSAVDATITVDGYSKSTVTVQITEQKDAKNTFALSPAGKLYFLSKRTGKIDVMKSDLDGGNAQTVLAGTGNESDTATVLLASRDWKYLMLKARRDGDKDKLYLIDTTQNDKLTTIDEGDATFTAVGWYNQYFTYTTTRNAVQFWQPKRTALKSFNAQSGQLVVLDETDANGSSSSYAEQEFGRTYILDNLLLYTKIWYGDSVAVKGKTSTLNGVQPSGQGKQTVKDFGEVNALDARLYSPQDLYLRTIMYTPYKEAFYEYEDGKIKTADISSETYNKDYPTFLLSPSGKSTLWSDSRDGKNVLFVGDADGNGAKELAALADYVPYGWFSDDYLLVSKNGSELYIMARNNPDNLLKVTDYHKPAASLFGYGYGYGGY